MRNKRTVAREAAFAASGLTPLEFLLSVLNDEDAPTKERMWAAGAALPLCHAKIRPIKGNAGGVSVQVCQTTHEEALAELDALGDPRPLAGIDKNNRKQYQPVEQAPAPENAMDRMEAEWFNPDSRRVAHDPALPPHIRPGQTPPQPPVPALVAAPVPHENRPVHWAKGNGTSTGPPRRVNGASRPRPGNGAVVRRSDEEIRNISDRRPMTSGYPRTRPVHGVV